MMISNEEALFNAIIDYVDPDEYNGSSAEKCVIGQVAFETGYIDGGIVDFVSEEFGVKWDTVMWIWESASEDKYRNDFNLFMDEYVQPLLKGEF